MMRQKLLPPPPAPLSAPADGYTVELDDLFTVLRSPKHKAKVLTERKFRRTVCPESGSEGRWKPETSSPKSSSNKSNINNEEYWSSIQPTSINNVDDKLRRRTSDAKVPLRQQENGGQTQQQSSNNGRRERRTRSSTRVKEQKLRESSGSSPSLLPDGGMQKIAATDDGDQQPRPPIRTLSSGKSSSDPRITEANSDAKPPLPCSPRRKVSSVHSSPKHKGSCPQEERPGDSTKKPSSRRTRNNTKCIISPSENGEAGDHLNSGNRNRRNRRGRSRSSSTSSSRRHRSSINSELGKGVHRHPKLVSKSMISNSNQRPKTKSRSLTRIDSIAVERREVPRQPPMSPSAMSNGQWIPSTMLSPTSVLDTAEVDSAGVLVARQREGQRGDRKSVSSSTLQPQRLAESSKLSTCNSNGEQDEAPEAADNKDGTEQLQFSTTWHSFDADDLICWDP